MSTGAHLADVAELTDVAVMLTLTLAVTGVLMGLLFVLVFWLNDPTVDTDWDNPKETIMSKFAKFYTALTAGALTWAAAVVVSTPAAITASEWVTGAGVAVAAIAVLVVPNTAA